MSIADDDISFDFSTTSYSTNEAAGNAVITIVRLGRTNGTASVNFSTSDGTAKANVDYQFISLQLNFADGQTSTNVLVPIINNGIPEGNVTVNLNLSSPTNATLLQPPPQSTLTILHNEDVLSFEFPIYSVDEGASNIVINVFRLGVPGTNPVTVRYFTTDGTATAGLDYTNVSGTLIFNQFDFVQSFSIPIIDDSIPEGDGPSSILTSRIGRGESTGRLESHLDGGAPALVIFGGDVPEQHGIDFGRRLRDLVKQLVGLGGAWLEAAAAELVIDLDQDALVPPRVVRVFCAPEICAFTSWVAVAAERVSRCLAVIADTHGEHP